MSRELPPQKIRGDLIGDLLGARVTYFVKRLFVRSADHSLRFRPCSEKRAVDVQRRCQLVIKGDPLVWHFNAVTVDLRKLDAEWPPLVERGDLNCRSAQGGRGDLPVRRNECERNSIDLRVLSVEHPFCVRRVASAA